MDVRTAIETRRKIEQYEQRRVPDALVRRIVEAGYLAPVGYNPRSRQFVVVRDKGTIEKLSEVHPFAAWMRGVDTAIALLGAPGQSRYWVEDCSIAGAFIWLAATDEGLGAAWAAIYQSDDPAESQRREQYVRDLLSIPSEIRIVGIIGLGYAAQPAGPKPVEPPSFSDAVFGEVYGKPSLI